MKYLNIDGTPIEGEDLNKFIHFIMLQNRYAGSKIKILYRGDNLTNFENKLSIENHPISREELLSRFFMVGEKSKKFYLDNSGLSHIKINQSDKSAFEFIFKALKKVTKSKNLDHEEFFNKNEAFKEYFNSKKEHFLDTISILNIDTQLSIKDYYLKLLHQLGSINYRDKSQFVSNSESQKIAGKFSKNKGEEIKIYSWIPRSENRRVEQVLKKYNLPFYKEPPYVYQREISVVAGILPHFVTGVEYVKEKAFYINPNIFNSPLSLDILMNGLKINQENFHTVLLKTKYGSSFETDGINYIERKPK